jgi:protein involved in polysaccharide export with SLBB domain
MSSAFLSRSCSCLSLVLVLGACPHHRTGSVNPPIAVASDTTLGPGDVFSVEVFGEKDLSGKFRVSGKGTIDYPLIGSIQVRGLTPPAVSKLITRRLSEGYMKTPSVSVFVEAYNSKKISVFGQVRKPGTFNYVDNMSIIEAITLAGGFTPLAAKNKISVTRTADGKSRRFTIPVEEIGEGTASNYLVRAGDIVFVPERVF